MNKLTKKLAHLSQKEHNRLEDEATINALRSYGYEVIKWHPYPQEIPTKIRHKYIVSAYMGGELVTYEDFYGEYDGAMTFMLGCPVIAWAEFPRPYEVEE